MERNIGLSIWRNMPERVKRTTDFLLKPPLYSPEQESPQQWALRTWEYAYQLLIDHETKTGFGSADLTLSENSLCMGLDRYYSRLTGFEVVSGMLRIGVYFLKNPLKLDGLSMFHRYAINPKTEIVFDLTFAQAIEKSEFTQPGDRIRFIKEAVPDLVTVLPNGLALLCGNSDEIYERTGLAYEDEEFFRRTFMQL